MAWEIVREESIEDPGSRSRLWDPDDIYQVLKYDKGSKVIRSIAFNFSAIKELQLSPQVFAKMSKLQFLSLYSKEYQAGLYLPQGLESLPNELRYLTWMHCPLESLPMNFSAEKLVVLDLPHSRVEKLWHGVQNLLNLRVVILYNSSRLTRLPDFSKARNLEVIDLSWSRLACMHPSIFCLDKLEVLDLSWCFGLKCLPSNVHLRSLRYLSLSGCVRLTEFLITSESMKVLSLHLTGIKQLPSSFGRQSKLETLLLTYSDIESLPATMKNLTSLRYIDIAYCGYLRTLPELPPSLEKLDARSCISLTTVLFPLTIAEQLRENRKTVLFWNCLNLDDYSLWAIGLNAQINIVKLAFQHLSALETDYHKDCDAQGIYVYPGSRVPEWLLYVTTRDYVTIDLSSAAAPHSPVLGFIFCFIVPPVPSRGFDLKFSISVGEDEENSFDVYLDRPRQQITSDHVCLIHDQRLNRYLNSISRAKNQQKLEVKVRAASLRGKSEYVPVMLRGFGVSPINALEYHNFIQQVELVNSNPKCPISHFHLPIRPGSLVKNQHTWLQRLGFDDQDGCSKFTTDIFKDSSNHVYPRIPPHLIRSIE